MEVEELKAEEKQIEYLKSLLEVRDKELEDVKSGIKELYCKFFSSGHNLNSRHDLPRPLVDESSVRLCPRCKFSIADTKDADTQTFESDFLNEDSTHSALDWATEEGTNVTVSDLVQDAVANANSSTSDYVYDENYKMYYSASTGYYYDSVRNLLYEPYSQTYYIYDQEKNAYEVYYQNDDNAQKINCTEQISDKVCDLTINDSVDNAAVASESSSRKSYRRRIWRNNKRNNLTKHDTSCFTSKEKDAMADARSKKKLDSIDDMFVPSEDSSPEDGEICSDSSSSFVSKNDGDDDNEASLMYSQVSSPFSEDPGKWPPCIRAIVKESTHQKLGSLVLITCDGGIIGREKTSDICVPDISVSREHAKILFDNEAWQYHVIDLSSQNGTFINDTRLSTGKDAKPHSLKHGDTLCLGSCKLLIHIHEGSNTCNDCEPGLIQLEPPGTANAENIIKTKEEKEKERRKNLKQIKKKFGLQDMNYTFDEKALPSEGYQDRSHVRRKEKGSQNPYEKDEHPTSTETALPTTNKGYKMLKSMGWTEGQALGTSNESGGLVEPVQMWHQSGTAGLGWTSVETGIPDNPRRRKWKKAQERYFISEEKKQ